MTAVDAARVVVIGAGFIGAEVASTCAGLGCRVTVLEAMDIPLPNVLGPDGRRALRLAARRQRGRAAHRGRRRGRAPGSRGGGGTRAARRSRSSSTGASVLAADVVVVGIGVVPATDGSTDSGLTLENGVVCDDRLFAADGIVAAGRHRPLDLAPRRCRGADPDRALAGGGRGRVSPRHAACWPVAPTRRRSLPIPYFWSDQYGIRFQVLGNPRGSDEVVIADGSFEEGKFVALFGRAGRLRAVMAIGKPRQLMGFRPLLEHGCSWDEALAHQPCREPTAPYRTTEDNTQSPRRRRPLADPSCRCGALISSNGRRTAHPTGPISPSTWIRPAMVHSPPLEGRAPRRIRSVERRKRRHAVRLAN